MTKRLTWQMGFDDAVSGGPSQSEYYFVDGRPEYRVGYAEYRQGYLEGTRTRASERETEGAQSTGNVHLSSTGDILLRHIPSPRKQAADLLKQGYSPEAVQEDLVEQGLDGDAATDIVRSLTSLRAQVGTSQRTPTHVTMFFLVDMVPRILIGGIVAILAGIVYRLTIAPPSFSVWAVIVTAVTAVALARVCAALLLVTAATMVDDGAASLTSAASQQVATAIASPHLTRFYLTRLGTYGALGLLLGLVTLLLDALFSSASGGLLDTFLIGPMAAVMYGYFSTGWDLARRSADLAPQ